MVSLYPIYPVQLSLDLHIIYLAVVDHLLPLDLRLGREAQSRTRDGRRAGRYQRLLRVARVGVMLLLLLLLHDLQREGGQKMGFVRVSLVREN